MLNVMNMDASIGSTQILKAVSLHVAEGTMCALIGRNGAGKTTLVRSIMGHVEAEGTVEFDHFDLLSIPAHARARHGLGYMPEDRRLVPEFTVEQNILLPVWAVGIEGAEARLEWIYGLMPEIAKFRSRRALELSGGQQKLVALARALMAGEKFLILDEPFEGLAPALARRLGEVIADLRGEGVSALIADSQESHVRDLVDASYQIERGEILAAA